MEVWAQTRADLGEEVDADDAYGDVLDSEALAFAEGLLEAYAEHQAEIDAHLEEVIQGWSFSQMAQTDLNVLRLALTEFWYERDVPKEVTIEIAVRIAKRFGGEESGRFVNGVLADLYRRLERPPAAGVS